MADRATRSAMNIRAEVDYIVGKAAAHDARLVTLGPLVFFSTQTGDAWVLDPADHSALCLARDSTAMPVNITETDDRFAIEWTCEYSIDGDLMTFSDAHGSRSMIGYPTREIRKAIRRVIRR